MKTLREYAGYCVLLVACALALASLHTAQFERDYARATYELLLALVNLRAAKELLIEREAK